MIRYDSTPPRSSSGIGGEADDGMHEDLSKASFGSRAGRSPLLWGAAGVAAIALLAVKGCGRESHPLVDLAPGEKPALPQSSLDEISLAVRNVGGRALIEEESHKPSTVQAGLLHEYRDSWQQHQRSILSQQLQWRDFYSNQNLDSPSEIRINTHRASCHSWADVVLENTTEMDPFIAVQIELLRAEDDPHLTKDLLDVGIAQLNADGEFLKILIQQEHSMLERWDSEALHTVASALPKGTTQEDQMKSLLEHLELARLAEKSILDGHNKRIINIREGASTDNSSIWSLIAEKFPSSLVQEEIPRLLRSPEVQERKGGLLILEAYSETGSITTEQLQRVLTAANSSGYGLSSNSQTADLELALIDQILSSGDYEQIPFDIIQRIANSDTLRGSELLTLVESYDLLGRSDLEYFLGNPQSQRALLDFLGQVEGDMISSFIEQNADRLTDLLFQGSTPDIQIEALQMLENHGLLAHVDTARIDKTIEILFSTRSSAEQMSILFMLEEDGRFGTKGGFVSRIANGLLPVASEEVRELAKDILD